MFLLTFFHHLSIIVTTVSDNIIVALAAAANVAATSIVVVYLLGWAEFSMCNIIIEGVCISCGTTQFRRIVSIHELNQQHYIQ